MDVMFGDLTAIGILDPEHSAANTVGDDTATDTVVGHGVFIGVLVGTVVAAFGVRTVMCSRPLAATVNKLVHANDGPTSDTRDLDMGMRDGTTGTAWAGSQRSASSTLNTTDQFLTFPAEATVADANNIILLEFLRRDYCNIIDKGIKFFAQVLHMCLTVMLMLRRHIPWNSQHIWMHVWQTRCPSRF